MHQLRFSANIAMLFSDLPFLDRIDAAAHAGFAAVECHQPYDFKVEAIRERLTAHKLVLNGINTRMGNPDEFGLAAMPGREDAFRETFAEAMHYARALSVSTIHVMSGTPHPRALSEARAVFLSNMRMAAAEARRAGVTLLIEPLNVYDRPGYFVSRSDEVVALLEELGEDCVKMMFDIYHVQIMEGDILRRMDKHWPHIGHIQVAGVPSRHEPDVGEVAYGAIFRALQQRRHAGWIGAEYWPRGTTQEGLGWRDALTA